MTPSVTAWAATATLAAATISDDLAQSDQLHKAIRDAEHEYRMARYALGLEKRPRRWFRS